MFRGNAVWANSIKSNGCCFDMFVRPDHSNICERERNKSVLYAKSSILL